MFYFTKKQEAIYTQLKTMVTSSTTEQLLVRSLRCLQSRLFSENSRGVYRTEPHAGAVLRGGQGRGTVRALLPLCPPIKLVARYQGYTIAIFTARNRIAGVKLRHLLNYTLRHPEFLPPPPQTQMWPPQTAAARNAPVSHQPS